MPIFDARAPLLLACASALLALPACSGPGRGAQSKVLPVSELPESYRELWSAWLADAPDWDARRQVALRDPAQTRFLVENLVRTMLTAWGRVDLTLVGEEGAGPFERARAELVRLSEHSAPTLSELMGVGGSAAAELSSSLLFEIGRPAIPATVAQLEAERGEARMCAADLLARLPNALPGDGLDEAGVEARLLEHLASDPEWLVRERCARALGVRAQRSRDPRPSRTGLLGALRDADPAVRAAAAAGLGRLADPALVPVLIDHLERALGAGSAREIGACQAALRAQLGGAERTPADWRRIWREGARPAGSGLDRSPGGQ